MNENQLILDEVKYTIEKYLPRCCEELLILSETGVLPDGLIRLIARKIAKIDSTHKFAIVESMVKEAAMRRVMALSAENVEAPEASETTNSRPHSAP